MADATEGEDVKVILAEYEREADLEAYERGIPPRGRDTLLVSTRKPRGAERVRGLALARDDVIEVPGAERGPYYAEIRRILEPAFVR